MHSDFDFTTSRRSFLKGAGLAGAAGLLAACGGDKAAGTTGSTGSSAAGSSSAAAEGIDDTPITDFVSFRSAAGEIQTWNLLYSVGAANSDVLVNLWDGLTSADSFGKVVPAIATSWEHNSDSTEWTFHLHDDVDWCDVNGEIKAHLTAKDFLVGFEWVLNYTKNQSANTAIPMSVITGASDYYEYTKALAEGGQEEEARALTYEDMLAKGVGISAPDDYTVVYSCFAPCPYLDTMSFHCCFRPASEELINSLGVDGFFGVDYETLWYCGPYLIEEFISGNTKSYIPNPNWYGAADHSRFEHMTITMISETSIGVQLYQNGELDEITLDDSTMTAILDNPESPYYDQLCEKRPTQYSYSIHFNFQCLNPDGTPNENWNKAAANTAFRQCFNLGLDLTEWYACANKIHPLMCECNYYTMKGLCFTPDGTDYTRLVAKRLGIENEKYDGETMIRLRGHDITDLRQQAIDELTALGVTFPVHVPYYVASGNSAAVDKAKVLQQCITKSFGEDFVVLDIDTYVSSLFQEVITPQLHGFYINGWGSDYGDPLNFLSQEVLDNDDAYYAVYYANIPKVAAAPADYQADLVAIYREFTDMVSKASAIADDITRRYEAFADAEAYMIENALTSPCWYDIGWCLTHANEYSKVYSMCGVCNYEYVDWETRVDAYTTAEYEAFASAYEAATT